jgi:hypothetical protein
MRVHGYRNGCQFLINDIQFLYSRRKDPEKKNDDYNNSVDCRGDIITRVRTK